MSTLLTETFPPAPSGSNVALPQSELDDTEARLLQDILVDYPGQARRRGPLTPVSGMVAFANKGSGIVTTLDPQGQNKYAVLNGDAVNGYFSAVSDDLASKVDLAWPFALPANPDGGNPYRIVDAKPALDGGAMVGVSSAYDAKSPSQGVAFWKGGNKANYANTVTVALGSASVTGTGFSANVAPGMFLFSPTDSGYANALIGVVLQVVDDTHITLTAVSPYAVTAKAATFQALRGLAPKITKGRITVDTSAKDVNGGGTRFISQQLNTGSWDIFRASDMKWIGKVASVESDIHATLTANATASMADEAFVALRGDGDYSIINTGNTQKVGFLSAVYADRQWYANLGAQFKKTTRVWFSDTNDPEALDLADDGDSIDIISTSAVNEPIQALMPAQNALLVFKENETFMITGQSPSNFADRKLEDDGALSGMSVQPYAGGVIWAGREGIHFYDGIQVENLIATKIGDVWKNSVRTFDPTKYRMWSMVIRDHYYVWIERLQPTLAIVKGTTSTTPNSWGVMINMTSRAVSWLTNVHIRGAIQLPASTSRRVWFLVNDATKAVVCDAEDLFDKEGVDTVVCDGGTAGPDFFFESKKFDASDSLRLKRFKQLAAHYLAQGGDINIDVVLGLNNVGSTLTSTLPASVYTWDTLRASVTTWDNLKNAFPTWNDIIQGVFVPKRVRFMKKSQYFSFRLWQSSSTMGRLRIGAYQIAYKVMRAGRV